jgi:hypothetical protein
MKIKTEGSEATGFILFKAPHLGWPKANPSLSAKQEMSSLWLAFLFFWPRAKPALHSGQE